MGITSSVLNSDGPRCRGLPSDFSESDISLRSGWSAQSTDQFQSSRTQSCVFESASKSHRASSLPAISVGESFGGYEICQKITTKQGSNRVVVADAISGSLRTGKLVPVNERRWNFKPFHSYRTQVAIHASLHHENIARYQEVVCQKGVAMICSEFAGTDTLHKHVSKLRPFSESAIRHIFYQLVAVLSYCHSRCVYLRNMHPDGIFVTNDNVVKVVDFGDAVQGVRATDMDMSRTSFLQYIAPEAIWKEHAHYDLAKGDSFSLGVLLFEMWHGSVPFERTTSRKGDINWDGLLQIGAKTPPKLVDLITGLLQEDPEWRLSISAAQRHPWLLEGEFNSYSHSE